MERSGGRERQREWDWLLPEGECKPWVLCLEAFTSLLPVGILRDVSREGFSRIIISFPVWPFRVVVSTDWSVPGQGVLVTEADPSIAHLVLLLFWAWS